MFGLGLSEIIVILVVALIFIGPDKLPEVAQKLGKLVWQVKHSAEELRKELTLPDYDEFKKENILKKEFDDLKNIKDSILKTESDLGPKKDR